jgi:hypothetical protein
MESFNLKKLSGVEIKAEYEVKISSRLAVLENLYNHNVDINRTLRSVTDNIKTSLTEILGYYGLK